MSRGLGDILDGIHEQFSVSKKKRSLFISTTANINNDDLYIASIKENDSG